MKVLGIIGFGWLGKHIADVAFQNDVQIYGTTTTLQKIELWKSKNISLELFKFSSDQFPQSLTKCDVIVIAIPPSKIEGNYSAEMNKLIQQIDLRTKVVFISSTSVYPKYQGEYNEESEIVNSDMTEIENELLKKFNSYLILRCSGLIDEVRHPGRFLSGKSAIDGPHSNVNLIHGKDVANALFQLIKRDCKGIYNLSYSPKESKSDFYNRMSDKLQIKRPDFNLKSESIKRLINSDKIANILPDFAEETIKFLD